MDTRFEREMEQLRVKVLQMAAYADRALERALAALNGRDAELAMQVIASDHEINSMECEVDNLSLRLLALDQPVALDLRFIVASMRLVVDLERVGDEAANIARQAMDLAAQQPSPLAQDIPALGAQVAFMFKNAMSAFQNQNQELAHSVCKADATANELHVKVLKQCMGTESDQASAFPVDWAIRMVMIGRSLERIGDLSTNIAESAIFVAQGVSIKHHCERP